MLPDLRIFLVMGIPVLLTLGGNALFIRSRKKLLRGLGLFVALSILILLVAVYVSGLNAFFDQTGGGFADLVIILAAIPLALVLPMALYPLLSLRLSPSRAWIIPVVLNLAILVLTHWITQGSLPWAEQVFLGAVLHLALTVLSVALTWVACFWKRKSRTMVEPVSST